jgi:hypothetical protein
MANQPDPKLFEPQMTAKQKVEVFDREIKFIKNARNRAFIARVIAKLPNYFFQIPASSTGKYHPSYSLGDGGLVRHTIAAVRIAQELIRNQTITGWMTDQDKDFAIMALLVHDGIKCGLQQRNGKWMTTIDHPTLAAAHLHNCKDLADQDGKLYVAIEDVDTIMQAVESHMGEWNKDWKTGKEVLPKPKGRLGGFVHLCDYLASRKCLEFNFDAAMSD